MAAETKFLGMDSSQIPMFSVFAAFLGVMLTTLAILIGMFFSINGDNNALRAEIAALRAEMNAGDNAIRAEITALRADISANDNAIRAEFNIRLDALSAEVAEVKIETVKINARLDGIETRLDAVETRLDAVENGLADVDTRLANVERLLPDYNASRARIGAADRVDALAAAAPE